QDIDLIDILWRQDIDLGAGREIFDYSHRQKESEVDKELSDGRERGDSWRSGGNEGLDRNLLVDGETGESFPAQVNTPRAGRAGVCARRDAASRGSAVPPRRSAAASPADVSTLSEAVSGESRSAGIQTSLLSPLLAETESPFDLEQQWQDLMSIMEMQAMEVNNTTAETLYNSTSGDLLTSNYSLAPNTPINQNVSLHQASLGSCSQDFSLFSSEIESPSMAGSSALLQLAPDNSTGLNSTFGSTNLSGIFFP
ncbi:NF2L1 protein, partial [Ciccaba nigrolineata]|nr:NF2L1 protein [Ciccaba nigrolineata]